jgi:hypothetical protein
MRYMLLLYANHADWAKLGAVETERVIKEHMDLIKELRRRGQYRTSDALSPTGNATTVRIRSGKTVVSDGPFAETKEQLGGYYVVEAGNLDEAIAIAERIPDARVGCVEIRPIRELE